MTYRRTFDKTIYSGPDTAELILAHYRSYLCSGIMFKSGVEEWLDENVPEWKYEERTLDIDLIFPSKDDYMLFKLVWEGDHGTL